MRFAPVFFAALLFSSISFARSTVSSSKDDDADYYTLSLRIIQDGQIIGSPIVSIPDGASGTVTSTGKYNLFISFSSEFPESLEGLRDAFAQLADDGERFFVQSELMLPVDGKWKIVASPVVSVSLDEEAVVESDVSLKYFPASDGQKYIDKISVSVAVSKTQGSLADVSERGRCVSPIEGDSVVGPLAVNKCCTIENCSTKCCFWGGGCYSDVSNCGIAACCMQ